MSIVGTSYHDPQEWKADKKEVSRCQESIQCQERTILRTETFGSVLRQSIDRMEERLDMKKQDYMFPISYENNYIYNSLIMVE